MPGSPSYRYRRCMKLPVRTGCAFAPCGSRFKHKIDICKECWKVPGDISDSFFRIGVLMLEKFDQRNAGHIANVFSSAAELISKHQQDKIDAEMSIIIQLIFLKSASW